MNNKQIVEDLLRQLPESASLHDIARRIEFVAAIQEGIFELDHGLEVPLEEVEREFPSWLIR
jgi:predicted transcriptional regulator